MRLILHAGTHKTGTTSIQAALAANRRWLAERGYVFPSLCGSETSHNHFAHRIALAANPQDLAELRDMLLGTGNPHRATILSGEEMSARIAGTKHWEGYDADDYWDRKAEYLLRLRTLVRDFSSVAVFLCFRRADEYAESIYSTMVLSGRFRGTFADFLHAVRPIFLYGQQLDAFRSVFEDVRIISFDALASDLIPAFCWWTGIPTLPDEGSRKKVTPDKRLIDWAACTIAADPKNDDDRRQRAQFVRSDAARRLFEDAPPATLWPDRRQREEFASQSAAGLTDGFFSQRSPRNFVDAHLNDAELSWVSQAFESWRAKSYPAKSPSRTRSIFAALRGAG